MAPSQLSQLKASVLARRNPQTSKVKPQAADRAPTGHRGSSHPQRPARRPKSEGEALRRRTLLGEVQNRHKVGGIIDRRIGENDPALAPEDRALQRFERQRKRESVFNLEDGGIDDDEHELTHMGRAILVDGDGNARDDFEATQDRLDDDDEAGEDELFTKASKKRRFDELENPEPKVFTPQEGDPLRKKSKREVMEEVIAKSKFYKYERQQAKEDDDIIREELDKGLPDLMAMLQGRPRLLPVQASLPASAAPVVHPDRIAMMEGRGKAPVEVEITEVDEVDEATFPTSLVNHETRTSQTDRPQEQHHHVEQALPPISQVHPDRALLLDGKAKAEKEYDKNYRQMLLDKRAAPAARTMTEEEKAAKNAERLQELEEQRQRRMRGEPDSDDESAGVMNDEVEEMEELDQDAPNEAADFGLAEPTRTAVKQVDFEDEDEFDIDEDLVANASDIETDLSDDEESMVEEHEEEEDDAEFLNDVRDDGTMPAEGAELPGAGASSNLAYTYPCPRSHTELLAVLRGTASSDFSVIVQRIRALYHPQLSAENKEKLADLARALVEHLSYLGTTEPSLPVIESLIRHLHSMSRSFTETIARAFRLELSSMQNRDSLNTGDLYILTAIGSIYPTSDHFHQVVTPAITIMARWLSMTTPSTAKVLTFGAYIVALCIKYQTIAKRYVPEAVRFTTTALNRNIGSSAAKEPHVENLIAMMDLWSDKASFTEIFSPALPALESLDHTRALQKLRIMLSQARLLRRPLELHHHRPLPIKSAIPKFEEGFNPNKHYDPDKERAEAKKLKAEYKREKKGAIRELRKDASFLAREKLRNKREADKTYEDKQRRLIAEINAEEGKEKNAYEREKRARKGRR